MLWKGRGRNRAFKRVGNLTFGSGVGGRPDMASKKKKMLERKGLPLAYLDLLGTRLPRIKVQVKRQQQRISRDGLSSFLAHANEEDVGLVVNIGGFTKDAEEFARSRSGGRLRSLTLSGYRTFGSANVPLCRLVTLSRHWYAQSPIPAATRLEANRASLFQSLRMVAAHPVEAALQFAGVPAAYVLAGRPHPISELGHAERRRVHVESLADAACAPALRKVARCSTACADSGRPVAM